MGLISDCKKYFGSEDLYSVLSVSKQASEEELKKAYKKVCLLCHPDKVPSDKKEEATIKFQIVSKIHSILADEELRAIYDETGCIDEENAGLEDKDWSNYWRLIFPKVTKKDIDNFFKKYNGSEEEVEDLKKCYIKYEGDMNKISETCIGYNIGEEDRYQEILRDLIERKEIPDFPAFSQESRAKKRARVKRYEKEASEAENIEASDSSLINAIAQRQESRQKQSEDFFKNLEAKYCKSGKDEKKKGRKK